MKIEKKLFLDVDAVGRPVFPGFISYIDEKKPFLIHRFGRLDFSDGYDDFCDSFSYDNGRTWTEPFLKLKGYTDGGKNIRYVENACFFDRKRKKLFTFVSKRTYSDSRIEVDGPSWVVYDVFDIEKNIWSGEREVKIDLPGGLLISFCFPLQIDDNTVLIPAITREVDANGKIVHYRGCWAPANMALTVKMNINEDDTVDFIPGNPAWIELDRSSRGTGENTIIKLKNKKLAMVCRGDNSMFPEKPGYKWVCFSDDNGMNWSAPEPFMCDDGTIFESGSNGSALLRSVKNGKIYWIGNLCIEEGLRAKGNWPRYPLVIAEIKEEPFSIIKASITIIDTRMSDEPETIQLSNFRFYQDIESSDIMLLLTRFGERDIRNWKNAGYYRYRIKLEGVS
ncbi:MAG: glycoside hydrolase [bacterium]|nr:glycoside hydrolase [bacterium]